MTMDNAITLPFKLDNNSINDWLKLDQSREFNPSIDQVYHILECINIKTISLNNYYLIIDKVTPQILQYAEQSNFSLLSATSQNFAAKKKPVQLAILLLKALSLAYSDISDHKKFAQNFTQNQQARFINRAIACIGLINMNEAVIQEPLSRSFYAKLGSLYCIGAYLKLIDHPTQETISQFIDYPTIIASIKRNLMFSIINCFALSPKQIVYIHGFICKAGDALEIKPRYNKGEPDMYWDYKSNRGLTVNILECNIDSTLIFNATEFSEQLQQSQSKHSALSLPETELEKIILTFTNFQEITQSIIPSKADICQVVIGFMQTIDYLEQLEKISKIYTAGSSTKPLNEENNILKNTYAGQTQLLQISDHVPAPNDDELVNNARKLKTNYAQYIVIELKQGKFYANNLILIRSGEGLDLGIIRSIQMTPQVKNQRLIVEILDNIVSYAEVKSRQAKTKGLIQFMPDESFSIFLPYGFTTTGMTIEISRAHHQSEQYQATKLLESRPRFQHFKITPH